MRISNFLTTGLILVPKAGPIETIAFAWHFGSVALMTGVVSRHFLRMQPS